MAGAPLDAHGPINCSPKGNRDELRVLDGRRVAYRDQTGSGVETIAHLRGDGRIVLMFCAFSGPPRIVRLHGRGRSVGRDTEEFARFAAPFALADGVGVRSVVVVDVVRVSDSRGDGVPFMSFESHRPTMDQWSTCKGPEGNRDYSEQRNGRSVDGLHGVESIDRRPRAVASRGGPDRRARLPSAAGHCPHHVEHLGPAAHLVGQLVVG